MEHGETSPDRLGKIVLFGFRNAQRGAQDLSRLLFHRTPVLGGLHPESGFGLFIESANGERRHTAMLACRLSRNRAALEDDRL